MKNIVAVAVTAVLAAGVASAQYKPKPKTPAQNQAQLQAVKPSTEFRRISREEAYKLYQKNEAVFVDVRSHHSFSTGHIKGALSIPGSQLIQRFSEVTPGKIVITYCACDAEQSSGKAVLNLNAHGIRNAAALKGGIQEWKAARLPIAAGPR
jgi:rhodanese-related sulfurtransferase